jgi:cysteine desulfuration protein SufE
MSYPAKLSQIIELFETLPNSKKREALISYADSAMRQGPKDGETFDLEDIRKDEECTDSVGVFLKICLPLGDAHFGSRWGRMYRLSRRR